KVADLTAPLILSSPASVTIAADTQCQGVVPNVLSGIQAVDNCTPAAQLRLSQNPAAGTVLPKGNYVIGVTVTDAAGNSSSTTVTLNIVDASAPTIQSLVATPNVIWSPNHQLVPVKISALVSDSCDAAPVTKIVSITADESTAPGDIQITGNLC